jgi:hypothetical protein
MATPGQMAASLYGQDTSMGGQLFGQAQNQENQINPFYQQELNDPQGLGATTMAQQLTQAGQGIAGATGAARRTATDLGSRTGNTAAIPSIINSADKTGIANTGNTVNALNIQNAMQKLNQQQEGAAGESGLFGQNSSNAANYFNQANNAINTRIKANQAASQEKQAMFKDIGSVAGGVLGGISGLDMTGGSSLMEQLGNFAGGA